MIVEGSETAASSRTGNAGWDSPALFRAAILGALAVVGVMALPLFSGRVNINNDIGWDNLPTRIFYADCLAKGEAFDWMSQTCSGFYLSGSGDVGGYHPFRWFIYRWLPLPTAFQIELIAAYPFLWLGMFVWLRRMGLPREIAAAGGLFFTFSSFCMLHFVHSTMVGIVAHMPWLLTAIDVVVRDPRPVWRSGARLAIALLIGSQTLMAHPQSMWLTMVVEVGYLFFLLLSRGRGTASGTMPRSASRVCLEVGAAAGLGLLLGAIQILPMSDALALSARPTANADYRNSFSLHPLNLVQTFAPYLFHDRVLLYYTHEFGLYVGVVPLMLILWLPGRSKELGAQRSLMWAAVTLAILGTILAFGSYGLLYELQWFLPWVGKFRAPCRYSMLANLAVSVLAAIGLLLFLDHVRRGRPTTYRQLAPIMVLVVLSVVAAIVGMVLRYFPTVAWIVASPYQILAGPLLFGSGALIFTLAARGSRIGMLALIAFATVDLGVYGLTYSMAPGNVRRIGDYLVPGPEPQGNVEASGTASVVGTCRRPSRVFIDEIEPVLCGSTRVDGYVQLIPARQLDYLRLETLRVAAVDWVRKNKSNAGIEGLRDCGGDWLAVPDPLPPVRLVSRSLQSFDPAADLARIDYRGAVLTDEPIQLTSGTPGKATVVDRRPGRFELSIDAPSRQILAIAESYHPGWKAIVAGRPEAVLRVNGDFLGCLVGPGRQHVTLVFQPRSLHDGYWISIAAVGVCCAWAMWVLVCSWRDRTGRLSRSSGIESIG